MIYVLFVVLLIEHIMYPFLIPLIIGRFDIHSVEITQNVVIRHGHITTRVVAFIKSMMVGDSQMTLKISGLESTQ